MCFKLSKSGYFSFLSFQLGQFSYTLPDCPVQTWCCCFDKVFAEVSKKSIACHLLLPLAKLYFSCMPEAAWQPVLCYHIHQNLVPMSLILPEVALRPVLMIINRPCLHLLADLLSLRNECFRTLAAQKSKMKTFFTKPPNKHTSFLHWIFRFKNMFYHKAERFISNFVYKTFTHSYSNWKELFLLLQGPQEISMSFEIALYFRK